MISIKCALQLQTDTNFEMRKNKMMCRSTFFQVLSLDTNK